MNMRFYYSVHSGVGAGRGHIWPLLVGRGRLCLLRVIIGCGPVLDNGVIIRGWADLRIGFLMYGCIQGRLLNISAYLMSMFGQSDF